MSLASTFDKRAYWIAPFAAVYAWVVILTSAELNPWWSVTAKALSYLGASTSTDPWLYDYVGMVPTGIMLAVFSIYLVRLSRNRAESLGSFMFLLAGILLIGIGIFHQGPGWYPVGSAKDGQNLHDLFSAWFFLQLLLTVLFWGWGLRKEGRRPLGLGMYTLGFGSLAIAAVFLAAFGTIPGGTGEVLGVLAIDVWVAMMFFGKEPHPVHFSSHLPAGLVAPEEEVQMRGRRSLVYAFQVPALGLVLFGMFLFFYGNYYLIHQLVGLIQGTTKVSQIVGPVITLYLAGFAFIVLGAWRWSVALPRLPGAVLLCWVAVLPLVMVGSWFDTAGDVALLLFFLAFGVLLPLVLSLLLWHRSRYVLTAGRVLSYPGGSPRDTLSLPRAHVAAISIRRGLFHRWFDVGTVTFLPAEERRHGPWRRREPDIEWAGVSSPKHVAEAVGHALKVTTVHRRRRLRPSGWVLGMALVVPFVLATSVVPVYKATSTLELPCAFILSDLKAIEDNPWPYLHNDTLPIGSVSFHWWSGTDVYVIVGQLPSGHIYQSANVSTSSGTLPSDLTSSGSGTFTSYGGDSFAGCISLSSGAAVTLTYSYSAPLVWS